MRVVGSGRCVGRAGELARVRAMVAAHANTAADILAELAGDEDPVVLIALAGNPHTPPDLLAALGSCPDPTQLGMGAMVLVG